MPACSSMHRAHLTRVRFIRSATPFNSGVYGGVNFWMMPRSAQNLTNLVDLYSPPLSLRSTLIRLSVWFSANLANCTNLSKTSDLFRIRYTAQCRDLSSTNVTKYFMPPNVEVLMGPHTSLCTTSSRVLARSVVADWNWTRVCLP